MAGVVEGVELVLLAVRAQLRLDARDLLGIGVRVLDAEQAEQRTAQVGRHVDRRDRARRGELLGGRDDPTAVAVDRRVDVEVRGDHVGLAPAGAVPDDADATVRGRERTEEADRPADVADALRVGDTTRLERRRGRVGGRRAGRVAVEQVRADRAVSVDGERAHHLLGRAVEAGHVVDHHDAGERSRSERTGEVRLDVVAAVTGQGHGLRHHRCVHRAPSGPSRRRRAVPVSCMCGARPRPIDPRRSARRGWRPA